MANIKAIRVLFVAISYASRLVPSDKQFVNDLIFYLPDDISPAVWTLTETEPGFEHTDFGTKTVPIYSVSRLGHKPLSKRGEILKPHPHHNALRQSVEITSSLLVELRRSLKKMVSKHKPDVIHFCDNVGPILSFVKMYFPNVVITCTKPSTRLIGSTGWKIYRQMLRGTYCHADKVIAFTNVCRTTLIESGIDQDKIITIPWGVKLSQEPCESVTNKIRTRYRCAPDDLLVVVLPRGSETYTSEMIGLTKQWATDSKTKYVFAIRPTRYSTKYDSLGNDKVIIESGPTDFYDLLRGADVAFAPQPMQFSTTLPPLVWLEAMARSTPIITRCNAGVDECVVSDFTGAVYTDELQVPYLLNRFTNQTYRNEIAKNAQILIQDKYNAKLAALEYSDLWKTLIVSHSN